MGFANSGEYVCELFPTIMAPMRGEFSPVFAEDFLLDSEEGRRLCAQVGEKSLGVGELMD